MLQVPDGEIMSFDCERMAKFVQTLEEKETCLPRLSLSLEGALSFSLLYSLWTSAWNNHFSSRCADEGEVRCRQDRFRLAAISESIQLEGFVTVPSRSIPSHFPFPLVSRLSFFHLLATRYVRSPGTITRLPRAPTT